MTSASSAVAASALERFNILTGEAIFPVTSGRISGCTSLTVTTQNMPTTIQPQQRKEKQ
jgi:hypothetical protein